MSPLWVLPLVVLAFGAVAVAVVARRLAAEAAALRPAFDDLRTIGSEGRGVVAEIEALRERGAEVGDIRRRVLAFRRESHDPGLADGDR